MWEFNFNGEIVFFCLLLWVFVRDAYQNKQNARESCKEQLKKDFIITRRFAIILTIYLLVTSISYGTFKGHKCYEEDCSLTKFGYEWAKKNDIRDVRRCDGKDFPVMNGCAAYIQEQRDDEYYYDDTPTYRK